MSADMIARILALLISLPLFAIPMRTIILALRRREFRKPGVIIDARREPAAFYINIAVQAATAGAVALIMGLVAADILILMR